MTTDFPKQYSKENPGNLLDKAFDAEFFRQVGHRIIDQLANYLKGCRENPDLPVLPWKNPEDMAQIWHEDLKKSIPTDNIDGISSWLDKLLGHSIHLHHPGNMGHQVAVPAPMASLGELISAFLNNSMAIYEVGPASTVMEKSIIQWLGNHLGLNQADGILTSGGSIGNLTALLAARQSHTGSDIWQDGITNKENWVVMVSPDSHYSISRAVQIMGLGQGGIIPVPLTKNHAIDVTRLKKIYQETSDQGKKVMALVANACTTATGTYDPINAIADFCQRYHIWLHIDAAHGGAAVFSAKYHHLLKGIDRADSIIIDFHKMMLCPSLTTAVIFNTMEKSYLPFSQKASYLLDSVYPPWADIAKRTLECTKKMMAVKVFLLIKLFGVDLFKEFIEKTYDLTREMAGLIQESEDFELAVEPMANILCFRHISPAKKGEDLNSMNKKIRKQIIETGKFYLVQTQLDGKIYMRCTVINPFSQRKDFEQLLNFIRKIYQQIISSP